MYIKVFNTCNLAGKQTPFSFTQIVSNAGAEFSLVKYSYQSKETYRGSVVEFFRRLGPGQLPVLAKKVRP